MPGLHLTDRVPDGRRVGGVPDEGLGLGAGVPELGDTGGEAVGVASDQGDLPALTAETVCDGPGIAGSEPDDEEKRHDAALLGCGGAGWWAPGPEYVALTTLRPRQARDWG